MSEVENNAKTQSPVCFLKERVSNAIHIVGTVVRWEDLGADTGCLSTNDATLVTELRKLAAQRRGGVIEIPCAEYEEKKKELRASGLEHEQRLQRQNPGAQRHGGAAVVSARIDTIDHSTGEPVSRVEASQSTLVTEFRKPADIPPVPPVAPPAPQAPPVRLDEKPTEATRPTPQKLPTPKVDDMF